MPQRNSAEEEKQKLKKGNELLKEKKEIKKPLKNKQTRNDDSKTLAFFLNLSY